MPCNVCEMGFYPFRFLVASAQAWNVFEYFCVAPLQINFLQWSDTNTSFSFSLLYAIAYHLCKCPGDIVDKSNQALYQFPPQVGSTSYIQWTTDSLPVCTFSQISKDKKSWDIHNWFPLFGISWTTKKIFRKFPAPNATVPNWQCSPKGTWNIFRWTSSLLFNLVTLI